MALMSLKASKSLKTSGLRANLDYYDQFRHLGTQSHQNIWKNGKKISKIFEPPGCPPRGTPYQGFQIEIQKTPRLSLE